MSVSPETIVSEHRSNVTLVCTTLGGPNNFYSWLKDGEFLFSGGTENSLTLTRISASDGGEYTCRVNNAAGSGFGNSTFYVSPYFSTTPANTLGAEVGENVNFMCVADGFPTPSVRWIRVDTGSEVANNSLLEFSSVSYDQAGLYQCLASSELPNGTNLVTALETPSILYGE